MKYIFTFLIVVFSSFNLNAIHGTDHKHIMSHHMHDQNTISGDRLQNYHYYQKNLDRCYWDWNKLYWSCN